MLSKNYSKNIKEKFFEKDQNRGQNSPYNRRYKTNSERGKNVDISPITIGSIQ